MKQEWLKDLMIKIFDETYNAGNISYYEWLEVTEHRTQETIDGWIKDAKENPLVVETVTDMDDWGYGAGKGETENYKVEFEADGGWEGDWAEMWQVFKVEDKKAKEIFYVRYTGQYSSWDSNYWEDYPTLVEPRQVVVTQYFKIEESK